jgi:uncharacterized protein YceH (UPF0502 family)
LIEKAKTTPDAYPLTVNAITTGCNQKNNRAPLMELESTDVELALDALRHMGAVTEIQGTGRVAKYRHNMYQWLGVEKVELAVMAELLLRGQQSVGELRGRAARMEPIADMNELRPVLASLVSKRLLVELTPAGRGQMVTHNLYEERELQKIRELVGSGEVLADDADLSLPNRPLGPPTRGSFSDDIHAKLREMQEVIDSALRRIEQLEARTR